MLPLWLRSVVALVLVVSVLLPVGPAISTADAANCRFVLGFKALRDAIPDEVGECKVNEHYNIENGDALQETTNGLMVWRKSDNFTAFTDGYRSWVSGPYGVQMRLNTERFPWEDNPATESTPPKESRPAPGSTPPKAEPPVKDKTPVRRLGTGTFLKDNRQREAWGKVTVANRTSHDVVVAVVPANNVTPVFAVYVRAGNEFTVDRLKDGKFYLYFTIGDDWDAGQGAFTNVTTYERFSEQMTFYVKDNRYNTYRVTLGGTSGVGNPTDNIDPADFPKLR